MVTDKQAGVSKLLDWSKTFYWSNQMFNIKLEENSYKMSFKALPVKIQQSKNQRGGAHPGQIGLKWIGFNKLSL